MLFVDLSTIQRNTYGYLDQYRCDTALYLLSILSHAYNVTFDCDLIAKVNVRENFDGLNDADKYFISILIANMQLPGSKGYYNYIEMCTNKKR